MRRRVVGNGCVGQLCSLGMSDLRHRSLFDRPDRLAADAVEHIEPRGLGAATTDVASAAVVTNRGQLRRGAWIEIPQIVVHELEVPQPFSRARVERDDRRPEQIAAERSAP
jgi:hypothetical protein